MDKNLNISNQNGEVYEYINSNVRIILTYQLTLDINMNTSTQCFTHILDQTSITLKLILKPGWGEKIDYRS